ncbi:MAG TPA: BACON domain-containing carbohydrate-binding protein [Bryobacteraceae bacterium]|nr:BACON domain-containing carbohydrate-binding protein [Bryobacteraceae bacterium]
MRPFSILLIAASASYPAFGQTYTINTVAGGGLPVDMSGLSASLGHVSSVVVDSVGGVFIASDTYNIVLRLDPQTGALTLVAGNGTQGFSGDGGSAPSAQLNQPQGLAVDSLDNLYIADAGNHCVRVVSYGVITTVAGTGGSGGANAPGTSAQLLFPVSVAVNSGGDLYIADQSASQILKVSNGVMTVVAGSGVGGFGGDNGPALNAELFRPTSVAVDSADNVYIADTFNSRVRKVSNGVITTVAGNGTIGYSGDKGPAGGAQLSFPYGVALDPAGNLYIADAGNSRIRIVSNGLIATVAGNGTAGFNGDYGLATNAQLSSPAGIALDAAGNLYIADTDNARVRTVSNLVITTVAGDGTQGFSGDGGRAISAQLSSPTGVAVDAAGNLYIADTSNDRVRSVSNRVITTVAGDGIPGFSGDNSPATGAQLSSPAGIAVDAAGNLYIADTSNARVRRVSNGVITTVAGNGAPGFSGDNGPATRAQLNSPTGIAVDAAGNLYIADTSNSRVRMVSNGVISTVVGNGTPGFSGDNGPAANAQIGSPSAVAVDAAGNLYIADSTYNRVRRVSNGVITTVAGGGTSAGSGPATSVQIEAPSGVAVDSAGSLYIAAGSQIWKVSSGTIASVAGGGVSFGDNGPATQAELGVLGGVAVDSAGDVYFADTSNQRIRVLTPPSVCAYTVSPTSLQAPPSGGNLMLSIQTGPGCFWSVSSLPSWIIAPVLSGQGPAKVTLIAAANSGAALNATIAIAGVSVTINQAAPGNTACNYAINPNGAVFPASGGTGTIDVTANAGCAWTATSSAPWITVSPGRGAGSGAVTYTVSSNTGAPISGTIVVAGLYFLVQEAAAPSTAGLTNIGSLAHMAAGGGWATTITMVNLSATSTRILVNCFGDTGNPLTLALTFPQTGENAVAASIDRTLGPGALLEVVAGGPALGPVVMGWCQLLGSGDVNAYAAFRFTSGTLDNQALAPFETGNASTYIIGFDNTNGFATGIALANTSSAAASVGIVIRDDTGATILTSSISLGAMAHTSFVLSSDYASTAGKRGTVELDSGPGAQIVTLGLEFNTITGAFSTILPSSK